MSQIESLSQGHGCFCTSRPCFPSKQCSRKAKTKRRKRKSMDQLRTLQGEYEKSADWGKEFVGYLASLTGLSEAQVYKWGWDQKKKQLGREKLGNWADCSIADLFAPLNTPLSSRQHPVLKPDSQPAVFPCLETILPSQLDAHLYQVQRAYKYDLNRTKLEDFLRKRHAYTS